MEQASNRVPRQALLTTLGLSAVLHAAALFYLAPRMTTERGEAAVAGTLRVRIVQPAPATEAKASSPSEDSQATSEVVAAPQPVSAVRPQAAAVTRQPPAKPVKATRPQQKRPTPAPRRTAPAPVEQAAVSPAAPSTAAPPVVSLHSPPRFDADYLHNPPPAYPPLARRMRLEGRVVLRVHVGPQGRPLEVLVDTGSGYAILDQAALEAVRRWQFVPARQGSEAVAAWVRVPLAFHIVGR
jgi:protein TonB